jgi:hypothetical protein
VITPMAPTNPTATDHGGEAGPHTDITKVVAQHGTATHSIYSHGGGAHHVTSIHPDGHMHISTGHPSHEHASEHMAIAHGLGE